MDTPMKFIKWASLAAVALLLVSCQTASDAFTQTITEMVARGDITPTQGEAALEAFRAAAASERWWEYPLQILGGAALAFLGVELRRGRPTQKFGLAESKIHKP